MTLLVVAIASPTAKIVHIDQRPYLFVLLNFCSTAIYQRDHLIVVYPIMVTPPPPPPPPPHIVAMGNDILRDLDDQQQKMDELFGDGWPESFLAAERTSRQLRRSRTPGDVNPPSHQSTSILFDNRCHCHCHCHCHCRCRCRCHRSAAAAAAAAAPTALLLPLRLQLRLPQPQPLKAAAAAVAAAAAAAAAASAAAASAA
jgi:hypothetical protein